MSSFHTFSIDDGDESLQSRKRFKPEVGRTYRASFSWWPGSEDLKPNLDAKGPRFISAQRYYLENVGYVIYSGPEHNQFLEAGKQPRVCLATVLTVWPTTVKGDIDGDRLKNGDFEVVPWVFSQDKYEAFAPINKEFPFGSCDLKITCTDAKFQKMTFAPTKESLLRKMLADEEKYKVYLSKILEQVKGVADHIGSEIGREYTVAQMREKLSGKSAVLNESKIASTAAEIDSTLESILDG